MPAESTTLTEDEILTTGYTLPVAEVGDTDGTDGDADSEKENGGDSDEADTDTDDTDADSDDTDAS
jgi:hypothetical protein